VLAVLLGAALTLPACSRDGDGQAGEPPSATTTADAAALARQWPFTGQKARGDLPRRRATVVKIDNTSSSRPQVGLGQADLVVQQLVEGGLTRLAVFYYSSIPSDVGPVRSMRTSDIGIVKPADGLLVASGGAPPTVDRVRRAGIPTATEGAAGFHRVSGRPSPYDLFVHLDQLVADLAEGHAPPPAYLPWGRGTLGGGKPATTIQARFSGGTVNTWTYDGSTYRRSIDYAEDDDFSPRSVLALRVSVTDAGYLDPAGNPVPETILSGRGAATLFHAGRAFEGRWAKATTGSLLRLVTTSGKPMPVPPGHTWLELVPADGGDLRYRGRS
jgi:hypothetical protein